MNREIKFRFWLDADKKMYKVLSLSGKFPDENFQRVFIDKEGEPGMPLNHRTENGNTIMQFTGMKDKNGKEIYEGDRRQNGDWVAWNQLHCFFGWFNASGYQKDIRNEWTVEDEIIGNIYENPELIQS